MEPVREEIKLGRYHSWRISETIFRHIDEAYARSVLRPPRIKYLIFVEKSPCLYFAFRESDIFYAISIARNGKTADPTAKEKFLHEIEESARRNSK